VQIDIRPVARLRGPSPLDLTAALGPVFEALSVTAVDLTRLKVVCDWIQYRADQLTINPDCGLRHLPADVARAKLRALVVGTDLVRHELART
jgi:cobalamin-independent methionine synthase catalytic subunit